MSAARAAAVTPRDGDNATSASILLRVRDTSPTATPSRPKRRAMARPRFGPAPTITSDMFSRLWRGDDQDRVAVGVVEEEHRGVAGQWRAAPDDQVVAEDLAHVDPGGREL